MKIKLTTRSVESVKPAAAPIEIHDAGQPGLVLRVQPSGLRSFIVVWGRGKRRTLGRYPTMTLDGARMAARAVLTEADTTGEPVKREKGTVADVCRDYVDALRSDGRDNTANDVNRRFERTIYSDRIGSLPLAKLSDKEIRSWRDRVERGDLAPLPVKKGRPPEPKPLSKAGVNRIRTTLVAALNHAVKRRRIRPERAIEWENVAPYEAATVRRELYLDREQRRALLANAGDDLRDLMECCVLTGCRPGDPAAVLRSDYDARHGAVTFKTKDHPRTIPLSPSAKALFDRLAEGKKSGDRLFTNAGKTWTPRDWSGMVKDAAAAAKLPADVVLYTLRHCWITDAITGGMDLLTVAKLAGTSLAMIEKHYGHLVHGTAREKLAAMEFL
ncbi:integrase family protein [uncultured Luteimonas sp.]|uniref:integrase family protein n=1 Tax=uncultured Luteimonas sp. TaxID=453144 RepID=UPI002622413D|nr:integrase family protein [uncultured Luteimonas sp.]